MVICLFCDLPPPLLMKAIRSYIAAISSLSLRPNLSQRLPLISGSPRTCHSCAHERTGASLNTWSPVHERTGASLNTWSPAQELTGASLNTWSPAHERTGASLNTWSPVHERTGASTHGPLCMSALGPH